MAFVSLFCHKFVIRKFIMPFSSLVMETNYFTRLKLPTPISNLKLKKFVSYLNLLWGVLREYPLSYYSLLLWLRYLPSSRMLMQGLKEYKWETMKEMLAALPEFVNQILLFKPWDRSDIYYFKIFHRKKWKNNSSNLHIEVWTRYFRHRYSIELSRT